MDTVAKFEDHVNHYCVVSDKVLRWLASHSDKIDRMVAGLIRLQMTSGRLFVLGVGGGAGNAAHAVNDYRKLCHIEAYAPTDSVAELTARTNDEGFDTIFTGYMQGSQFGRLDALMIFSVGGGQPGVSVGLTKALELAKNCGASIYGIVGKQGSATELMGTEVIVIPDCGELVTPITESFQMLIHHCLVSDPRLQQQATKW